MNLSLLYFISNLYKNQINIIKNNNVIPKSALLGKNTKMDAENYYIETGEMNNNLNELFNYFKIKGVNI